MTDLTPTVHFSDDVEREPPRQMVQLDAQPDGTFGMQVILPQDLADGTTVEAELTASGGTSVRSGQLTIVDGAD